MLLSMPQKKSGRMGSYTSLFIRATDIVFSSIVHRNRNQRENGETSMILFLGEFFYEKVNTISMNLLTDFMCAWSFPFNEKEKTMRRLCLLGAESIYRNYLFYFNHFFHRAKKQNGFSCLIAFFLDYDVEKNPFSSLKVDAFAP